MRSTLPHRSDRLTLATLWLIYVRRSYKKTATDKVVGSADTSDEVQLERCLALLPEGARYEVIVDSGGHQSGRGEKRDGWQEVIRRVAIGGVAGIIAYDVSRSPATPAWFSTSTTPSSRPPPTCVSSRCPTPSGAARRAGSCSASSPWPPSSRATTTPSG